MTQLVPNSLNWNVCTSVVTDCDLMIMFINGLKGQHRQPGSAVVTNTEEDRLPNGLFSIRKCPNKPDKAGHANIYPEGRKSHLLLHSENSIGSWPIKVYVEDNAITGLLRVQRESEWRVIPVTPVSYIT